MNKRLFGWLTMILSITPFTLSILWIGDLMAKFSEYQRYSLNLTVLLIGLPLLIAIGALRIICGWHLLKERFDRMIFNFTFILLCFFEVTVVITYSVIFLQYAGLAIRSIIALIIAYYIASIFFFEKLDRAG